MSFRHLIKYLLDFYIVSIFLFLFLSIFPLFFLSLFLSLLLYLSFCPKLHCSSSSSAPRNRSSPAIRKVPRQMAAVKMRTHNQRPRLLTVLRSRRATRPPLSWIAKLIPPSTCLSRDGSSWRLPYLSFYPGTIGYCGT